MQADDVAGDNMVQLSISSDYRGFIFRTCRSGLVIVTLAFAATACSSDSSEEYPNLNSVPANPGSSDSLAEARKIEEGLIADRANARYTDEVLRADTSVQAPLTPPPPKIEVEEVKEEVTEEVVKEEPPQEVETRATETVQEDADARAQEQTEEADAAATASVAQSAASAASSTEAPTASDDVAGEAVEETETEVVKEVTEEDTPVVPPKEEPTTAEVSETVEEKVEKVEEAQVAASEAQAVETATSETKALPVTSAPTKAVSEETEVAAIAEDSVKRVPSYRELADTPPLEIIFFEQGSNRINPEDTQKLTRIAQSQLAEGGKLKIVGHASSRTRELSASEYMIANLKASQQRAAAVAEALIELGVSGDDLILESVSDSFPLSRGGRPSDEARNRRAEIFLLN